MSRARRGAAGILLGAAATAATFFGEIRAAGPGAASFAPAIEDNSFLIEEAYNQEEGIVQHITSGTSFPRPVRDVAASFTQEWPVGGRRHQFSYTVPYQWIDSGADRGIGDVLLNYRHQVPTKDGRNALAPRLSLVLPSGDEDRGLGGGAAGFQANVPMSRRLSERFVAHANAGVTWLPGARPPSGSGAGGRETLTSYALGGSVIWLARPKFNVLFELLWSEAEGFGISGRSEITRDLIVSPGIRMAFDIRALQIVPGVALPLRFDDGHVQGGAFVYLSFEHPFGAESR